jgi:hypothetical protein
MIADPDRFVAFLLGALGDVRNIMRGAADLRQVKSDFRGRSPLHQ